MDQNGSTNNGQDAAMLPISGMYENYFLDYASYVILERAVPLLLDGLKPVQRRILHSMKEMDDGRFHKVANIIGQTMQYHPHGDAAIGDALVNLGQKELLIDAQGNWGDVRTGDRAAAPRYIEARLSKFALDVGFNAKITDWQASYDGRKREPLALPMKFPLVLAQGVEGIAVGLSTKIMPHNFIELCEGSIKVLQGKPTRLIPDFPTGGMVDAELYQGGARGGKIRVRARIEIKDKTTIHIKDIPYAVTTSTLIDSIIKANDKGKIKIKKVVDNTAQDVEVEVEIAPGVSPEVTMDALYAFTDCEVSVSPNACVIIDDKPHFLDVDEILRISTLHTKDILKRELEIQLSELKEKLLFSSLEKIFIENRIYRDIEEAETWEEVIATIDRGLEPFKPKFYREITEEDIVRLTEIRIKRISKFNAFKADELIRELEEEIAQTEFHLANLNDYTIDHYKRLIATYGKGRERKTLIQSFDTIQVQQVAVANEKLYVNRKEGFVGYGLKKDEYVADCSDLDDVIVFRSDGKYLVVKVSDKAFVGKDIIHVDVWKKNDERKVYHAIYRDPKEEKNFVKRFAVTAITRDREYDITKGNDGSKLLYFQAHPNSESEIVTVQLTPTCRAKIKVFDFDFAELAIKGRSSQGNVLSKYPIRKITQKEVGSSTLGGIKVWYDPNTGRLNTEDRGEYAGEFDTDDKLLVLYSDGSYELSDFDLMHRYDFNKVLEVKKLTKNTVVTALYYDGESKDYYVKRFQIETATVDKKFPFISEFPSSRLIVGTTERHPHIAYKASTKTKKNEPEEVDLEAFIDVKGWKAMGNKLDRRSVSGIKRIETPVMQEGEDADPIQTLKTGDSIEWEIPASGDQAELF